MKKIKYFFKLLKDLFCFASENKKLWLTPVFIILLLLTVIIILGSTPLAPFIYTLF